MTCLMIVRHAEAEGNIIRRFHGQTDSHLTKNGHKQAQRVAERLSNEHIDRLYSSDLSRAFQTAKYIGKVKNLDVHIIKGLREIDGGDWEDMSWEELPQKWPVAYDHWENKPHLLQMPNGESMTGLQQRVLKEIMEIVEENHGKNICVVTHGVVKKALLCYFYDKPLEAFTDIMWHDNASVTMIHIEDDSYKVVIEGDNLHLGELGTLAKQDWWKKDKTKNID